MDEAGAALDALRRTSWSPTRRPAAGAARWCSNRDDGRFPWRRLQHGFIYRHWLNYLHEPDEILPSDANPADRGIPLSRSHAAVRRVRARAPRARGTHSLRSPGGDRQPASRHDRARRRARSTPTARNELRESVGATPTTRVVLVASKFTQIAPAFRRARRARPPRCPTCCWWSSRTRPRRRTRTLAGRAEARGNVRMSPPRRRSGRPDGDRRRDRHRELDGGDRSDAARRAGAGRRPAEQPDAVRGRRGHGGRGDAEAIGPALAGSAV